MSKKDDILREITQFYLTSGGFNGLPIRYIVQDFKLEETELKNILISLIQEDKISLNFGDIHPNPHIKAFWEESKEKQIEKVKRSNLAYVCAYPSCSHLKEVVNPSKYQDRPFTLRLALGEPQLSFESFDLRVLEFYRNDPRYHYGNNNINGKIYVRDECSMPPSDEVFLQTFGFSYDSNLNRAVAVYLKYLSNLTPEHQQRWNTYILKGDYRLHPDYFKPSILGEFPEGMPIFSAFFEELHHINEMCKLIQRPPLFRNDLRTSFKITEQSLGNLKSEGVPDDVLEKLQSLKDQKITEEEKFLDILKRTIGDEQTVRFKSLIMKHADLRGNEMPREFCFLIRPTLKEYNHFVNELDKVMSDNINKKFFQRDIPLEYDEKRKDGKIIVREKGTIKILDEWLRLKFNDGDEKIIDCIIDTFYEIREERNPIVHKIDDDTFDQKYFKQQRELIIKAYDAIRRLRLIFQMIFSSHQNVKQYKIPDWLQSGKIWTY